MSSELEIYSALLNIENLKVERVEYEVKELHIYCYIESDTGQRCPSCNKIVSQKTTKYRREIRDLDISGRKVILHLQVHQYSCDCGRTFSESFDFVDPNKGHTKRQAKWIFMLSSKQSHLQVAALTDTNHKSVERICYNQIEKREVDYSQIRRIGIDEFAFKKGRKDYLAVIVDLDTHDIIDILKDRSKETLMAYFQGLGTEFCNQIEDFCSDMWAPFQDLARDLFINARIHVDRFHWTIHLNKVLDNTRKQLRRDNKKEPGFKNLKWKLIKRPEKLSKQEKDDLELAFQLNTEFEDLYEMRNTFQAIFDMEYDYQFAVKQIDLWIEQAKSLKNEYLDEFVQLFNRHRENILNYFKTRISSAAVEGNNNLLRTVKRFTFNMTNFRNFKARAFAFKY